MSIIRSSWLSLGLGKAGGELDVAPLRDGGIDIGMTHDRLAGSVRFTLHLDRDDATALRDWLTLHLNRHPKEQP